MRQIVAVNEIGQNGNNVVLCDQVFESVRIERRVRGVDDDEACAATHGGSTCTATYFSGRYFSTQGSWAFSFSFLTSLLPCMVGS